MTIYNRIHVNNWIFPNGILFTNTSINPDWLRLLNWIKNLPENTEQSRA